MRRIRWFAARWPIALRTLATKMKSHPLSLDLLKWVAQFQLSVNAKVTIDSLQISGLELEPDVTARLSIAGNKDVREALQRVTKGKRFDLERVQLKLLHENRIVGLQLINTGAAKLEEALVEDFLPALRQSLPSPPKTTG